MKICSIDGCERPVRSRGFCQAHYLRFWRHGSPQAGGIMKGSPAAFIAQAAAYQGHDCLLWPYGRHAVGYGSVTWRGRAGRTAHSVVCELVYGPKPSSKHEAAHACGNRICCTPTHLRWATREENQADKLIHGTHNRGERQGQSKLTAEQVREIRAQRHRLQRDLAAEYGVSDATISDIHCRRIWNHIR